ncbi:histidine phosphatase family protein [Nonomuraea candida]|uniref:histidine phosphatase family protein n=1 Tax=Nonomuraea candida TaxID=359159 RepID=UPI0005B890A5|nr:histidine phosphatase family protein [Nonomuraea candida]
MIRYLYLARHGEATPDESGLTEAGRRQAELLGERLRAVPLSAVHHGPLPRAAETARLVAGRLDGVVPRVSEAAGDYVPYVPAREELPPEYADVYLAWLGECSGEELERGPKLAQEALDLFTGPAEETRHELVVTHNFLIGRLVAAAHHAPAWRWFGLNFANAALTAIRYAPGRPPSVLFANDMSHLPPELRWTGFPAEPRA